MAHEQKANVIELTSEEWDEDAGGLLTGYLVANKRVTGQNKYRKDLTKQSTYAQRRKSEGDSSRDAVEGLTETQYVYIRTRRKLAGGCVDCGGCIIGHAHTRGALLRGHWTCQCGASGTGRELVDVEWFTTTIH